MQFLSNWTINISKIPSYVEFNQDFVEYIDYDLANIILEEKDESIANECMTYFSGLVACIDKNKNELRVKYSPRKGGFGRRYADCPKPTFLDGRPDPKFGKYYSGLITMSRKIKNTIFYYQNWRDYDQVKGHPTILLEMGKMNNVPLPAFEDYLKPGRFDEICNTLIEFYSGDPDNLLTRKDIKWLFNKTIYGGGFKEWINDIQNGQKRDVNGKPSFSHNPKTVQHIDIKHSLYKEFKKDTKTIINLVYQNNPELVNLVCDDLPDTKENLWSRKNRLMSYFCGIIEHEITFQAYKYITKNGICKKRYLSWGYDGFTIPPPDLPDFDEQSFLTSMNAYVCEKTGFKTVSFIRKEFEESDILFACIEKRKSKISTTLEKKRKHAGDDQEEDDEEDESSWKTVSEKFEQTHCKIINKSIFIKLQNNEVFVMSKPQLKTSYENMVYRIKDKKGKFKLENFIDAWTRNNPQQKCFDDIGIYPTKLTCPANIFNMWTPFAMEGAGEYVEKTEELEKILSHIRILCGNDEAITQYVIDWIAQMIQFPAVKTTCLTFISKQGAGKTFLIKLLRVLLGNSKVFETTSPSRDVWGDFNGRMCNTFLINLNELSKKETVESEGRIKGLITDPFLTINNKGVNQYDIQSYHRFIITTNKMEPLNTSADDRRNLIVRSSDEKCGDKEYFNELHKLLEDVDVMKTCYEHFKSIKNMEEFNKQPIPISNHQEHLKELSTGPIEQRLQHFTRENFDKKEVEMLGEEACKLFKEWWKAQNEDTPYNINAVKLGVRIKILNIDGIEKGKHTNRGETKIYNIEKLKKYFKIGVLL